MTWFSPAKESGYSGAGEVSELLQRYPVRLTVYLEELIRKGEEAIARQFLPDLAELKPYPGLIEDPLGEQQHSPLPGLIHRHPDRVLLLAMDSCAAICRFCFRKGRRFDSYANLTPAARGELITYLEQHREIREVILTGGDPLLLGENDLADLWRELEEIPHLETVRVHTRLPVVDPERVSTQLLEALTGGLPLYVMLHVNHPSELTAGFASACRRMKQAGAVLGSQTVLLKGVNDDSDILEALFRGLLRQAVRPYYLHHPDVARGTGHFRVPVEKGIALMNRLARRVSGLALPHYVIDLPGGKGKVRVSDQTVSFRGEEVAVVAPDGSEVRVPDFEGQC